MSDRFVCPRCGADNASSQAPCWKCHYLESAKASQTLPSSNVSPVIAAPAIEPAPAISINPSRNVPSSADYYRVLGQLHHERMINRTRTGLLLLAIGLILGPIPYISFIGGVLEFIGAILVILGRDVFGYTHARNTIISLFLYIIGFIALVISVTGVASSIVAIALSSGDRTGAVTNAINAYFVALIISTAIIGLGTLLFTYALQQKTGRLLLWTGFTLNIIVSTLTLIIISSQISSIVAETFASGIYNPAPIQSLQGQTQLLGLFGLIPALSFAIAYGMALSRINRGELPEPVKTYDPSPTNPSI